MRISDWSSDVCSSDLSSSSKPFAASTALSAGRPSVSVPVLSTTSVSTTAKRSNASAFLMSTPVRAPFPTPTMIDMGVANPSAQGQAMMSTDTAVTNAKAIDGGGAAKDQKTKASTATASPVGTHQAATQSTFFWLGPRQPSAPGTGQAV